LHRQPLPFVPRLVLAFQKAAASTANSGERGGASENREKGVAANEVVREKKREREEGKGERKRVKGGMRATRRCHARG